MPKKWGKYVKWGTAGTLVTGVAIGLPFAVINEKSYNLFAEIVVSDNTSVLADKSFSESTFDGLSTFLKSKDVDLPPANEINQASGIWRRPGATDFERVTTFKGLFASGKDMLIAPGFTHGSAIQTVAEDPDFFNKGFLFLDGWNNGLPNVSSFAFRADQAGFLAGVAACEFLKANADAFGRDGSYRVGGFVGIPLPSTFDFLAGFQAGVFGWNAKNTSGINGKKVEWISLGQTYNDYASGGFGVGQGVGKSKQLVSLGADVIIPIAGPQTADAVSEATQVNRPVVVVGVDSAQELQTINKPIPNQSDLNASDNFKNSKGETMVIQFSAEKLLANATDKVLEAVFDKSDPNKATSTDTKTIKGFGFLNTGTIENGTVGISNAGLAWISKVESTWVVDNKINWEKMKADSNNAIYKEFLRMTNDATFYFSNSGTFPTGESTAGGSFKFDPTYFTKLANGTAQAEKMSTKPSLNGSNWSVRR